MRRGLLALALGLCGCVASWDLREELAIQSAGPFWLDADGDGWGDPDSDPEVLKEPDADAGYTARNDRDCDDTDPITTGRTASACPVDTVPGGVQYATTRYGDQEFLAVLGSSATVWPAAAEDACGPWGWGGRLAEFADAETLALALSDDLDDVLDALPAENRWFAGFVGLEHNDTRWAWMSDGGAVDPAIPWCDGEPDPDRAPSRLALVRPLGSTKWCLGVPEDAGVDLTTRDAHFVCSRPLPDPDDWAQWGG